MIRFGWNKKTLTARFVRVLCVTFLPLGILTFVAVCLVVWFSSNQISASYEHSLEGDMIPLQENILETEEELDDFVLDHLAELTMERGHDEVLNYEMIEELGSMQKNRQVEGVAYLYDRSRASIYVKYNYDSYTFGEMENFRNKLLSRGFPEGTTRGWQLYDFDGKCFLLRSYSYAGYHIGLMVDMNSFMEGLQTAEELGTQECYLTDGEKIMHLIAGTANRYRDSSWEELLGGRDGRQFLVWNGPELGCSVALVVPTLTSLQNVWGYLGFLLLTVLLEILFIFIFWQMVKKWVVTPIHTMNEALDVFGRKSASSERYRITGIDEDISWDFRQMFENFNEMAGEVEEGRRREQQVHDMTLDNLKLRMNPHMLMNSLNLIYSMAQIEDYHSIQEFSLCMTDYFRYVLKETNDLVTVKEEMDFVKSYLNIQKIRFPDRFNCVYTMAEETENAKIPPLLIENFVENAVKYALIPGKITEILINIRRQDQWLFISITDTGRGIPADVMTHIQGKRSYVDAMGREHIGIANCRKWIEYYYEGKGNIRITSKPGAGTQVWIEVPFFTEERREDA